MRTTQNKPACKNDTATPKINFKTHVQIHFGKVKTVWFPRTHVNNIDGASSITLQDVEKWHLTAPGETIPFLVSFLQRLALVGAGQHNLIKFVDALPKEGFEACINLMLEIGYRFPADSPTPHFKVVTEWPEYLFDHIPICTEPVALEKLCASYQWYIAASRRVVTLAHVSKKGLTKAFLRAVGRIASTNPALAFALAPTTLHENTLVAPEIAQFFTCDPLLVRRLDVKSSYSPVIEQEACKNIGMAELNDPDDRPSRVEAVERVQSVTAFLRDGDGTFPWLHPERTDTGVLLAGGFPCAALLSKAKYEEILKNTDLDLFIYSTDETGQREMAAIILRHMEKLGGRLQQVVIGAAETEAEATKVLKTACVYQVAGLEREVQIILPFACSPLGVLINFDSTFIQVGYQERVVSESPVPSFIATPGYCFFTPRSESLITRYNIRYYRMMKVLTRGFIPVSDERGHLLYPSKIFFSSRWRLGLGGAGKRDAAWIKAATIRSYILRKAIPREEIEKLVGAELMEESEEKAHLALPDSFFTDREVWGAAAAVTEACAASYNAGSRRYTVSIWGPGGKTKDKFSCWLGKPQVTWVDVKSEEALANFDPQGATLSNGFDLYTAGVNNTLPPAEGGETEDLYEMNVLLRNIEILEPKKTYNLAAPEERPLEVKWCAFPDERETYRAEIYKRCGTEPVRTIEGVFLFGDAKTEEQIDADYIEYEKRKLASWEKFNRKLDLKARLINKREALRLQAEEDHLIKLKAARETGTSDEPTEEDERIEKLEARLEKLKAKETARLISQKAKKIEVREAAQEMIDAPKEERDPHRVKMASLITHIDFRDLHRYIATPKDMVCIGVEELPFMMRAFGTGEKEYTTKSGAVIKRSDGMVKVRATITFNPCMIFDVDDLFLPQRSLDTHAKRRYNAVVKLANLTRWIVKAHEHHGVLTTASSRKMIMAALQEELKDAVKKDGQPSNMPVVEFMRAIRHVANEAEFEEQSNKMSCTKPHAAKGMPGEMPALFCSRLYVTRHE